MAIQDCSFKPPEIDEDEDGEEKKEWAHHFPVQVYSPSALIELLIREGALGTVFEANKR